jgi:ABC-type antimicrobial peptide transport system permease subunit
MSGHKRKDTLRRILFVFITLLAASMVMILAAQYTPVDSFQQAVLISMASAIAGSALTFFLLQMTAWENQREAEEEAELPAGKTETPARE